MYAYVRLLHRIGVREFRRLIASQLIGYGLTGLARDYLVYPTWAVYPFLMPQVQLFDAMHRAKGVFLQRKRRVFFWTVLIGIFIWEWFPEYIATYVFSVVRFGSATDV